MTQEQSVPGSSASDATHPRSTEQSIQGIAGERTLPSINRTRSLQSRLSSVLAMALMGALGLGLLTWYYAQTLQRPARAHQNAQAAAQSRAQGELSLPSLGRIEPPPPATAPPEVDSVAAESSAIEITELLPPEPPSTPMVVDAAPPVAESGAGTPTKSPAQVAFERRLSGPPFVRGTATGQPSRPDVTPYIYDPRSPSRAQGEGPAPLAPLLEANTVEAAGARQLPTQQLLLPRGAFIDCTLETAIDSTLPGMTTCITATDTFSADGRVVLLERGTKLIGETRGEARHGMARLFVLWSEARTPTGVVVPLASPGTDELGRSGLPGNVNRHFFERFGAAILISLIEGAVQRASQPDTEGDSTTIINTSSATDLATEALKSTGNIPPTIVKPQGDRIQILVARDLDFRNVYQLHHRATQP